MKTPGFFAGTGYFLFRVNYQMTTILKLYTFTSQSSGAAGKNVE
jgi:hypothetical protein